MARKSTRFEFGPFRLDVRERLLTRDGHAIPLRGRVLDTLYALVRRHGCLLTKDELMAAVWPDSIVEETNLNHNICIIRRALGEKATGQRYVETVPKQGYRFVAQVTEIDDADGSDLLEESDFRQAVHNGEESLHQTTASLAVSQASDAVPGGNHRAVPARGAAWYQRQATLPLLAVAFLVLAGYLGSARFGIFHGLTNSRILLAVLPFEDLTGDSGQLCVADGLDDEIISQLGRWNAAKVGVIARTSSEAYQGTRKSIGQIGRELGVHYIVEGSVRRDQHQYRITVMLVRVKDQAHLWAASYDRTVESVTALQVEIASLVASEIGRKIDVEADDTSGTGDPRSLGARPGQRRGAVVLAASRVIPAARPPIAHGQIIVASGKPCPGSRGAPSTDLFRPFVDRLASSRVSAG
ncbi:MAG TPA: winged helix-turn-helix domain-containing protein [Terriglobia bacterium]|nr:winged helix-turn-helix domain-containing protein [Terriglobia bacterium]